MNNVIGILLGITDDTDPEWKYINRKGHVITCTKAQFKSYFKKRRTTHEQVMRNAANVLFAPCPLYFWLKRKTNRKE